MGLSAFDNGTLENSMSNDQNRLGMPWKFRFFCKTSISDGTPACFLVCCLPLARPAEAMEGDCPQCFVSILMCAEPVDAAANGCLTPVPVLHVKKTNHPLQGTCLLSQGSHLKEKDPQSKQQKQPAVAFFCIKNK